MITKEFVEKDGRLVCRATFTLPNRLWVESVHLVGDFNGWDHTSHPFLRAPDGSYSITLDLECGRTYQFRYLADGRQWMNDNQADGNVPNPFGSSNCLLITETAFKPYRDEEETRREHERDHR